MQTRIPLFEYAFEGKDVFVERYLALQNFGSNGVACGDFWINRAFPLLVQRWIRLQGHY